MRTRFKHPALSVFGLWLILWGIGATPARAEEPPETPRRRVTDHSRCVVDAVEEVLASPERKASLNRMHADMHELSSHVAEVTRDHSRNSGIWDTEGRIMRFLVENDDHPYPFYFIADETAQKIRATIKDGEDHPAVVKEVNQWVERYSSLAQQEEDLVRAVAAKREKYRILKKYENTTNFPLEVEVPVADGDGGVISFRTKTFQTHAQLATYLEDLGKGKSDILKGGKLRALSDLEFLRPRFAEQALNRRRLRILSEELHRYDNKNNLPFDEAAIRNLLDNSELWPPKWAQSAVDFDIFDRERSIYFGAAEAYPNTVHLKDNDKVNLGIGKAGISIMTRAKRYAMFGLPVPMLAIVAYRLGPTGVALAFNYFEDKFLPEAVIDHLIQIDDDAAYEKGVAKLLSVYYGATFDGKNWVVIQGGKPVPSTEATNMLANIRKLRAAHKEFMIKESAQIDPTKRKTALAQVQSSQVQLEAGARYFSQEMTRPPKDAEFAGYVREFDLRVKKGGENPGKVTTELFMRYFFSHPGQHYDPDPQHPGVIVDAGAGAGDKAKSGDATSDPTVPQKQ